MKAIHTHGVETTQWDYNILHEYEIVVYDEYGVLFTDCITEFTFPCHDEDGVLLFIVNGRVSKIVEMDTLIFVYDLDGVWNTAGNKPSCVDWNDPEEIQAYLT